MCRHNNASVNEKSLKMEIKVGVPFLNLFSFIGIQRTLNFLQIRISYDSKKLCYFIKCISCCITHDLVCGSFVNKYCNTKGPDRRFDYLMSRFTPPLMDTFQYRAAFKIVAASLEGKEYQLCSP